MSDARVEWHGDEASKLVRGRVVKALYRAAYAVQRRAKELLSVAGTVAENGRFSHIKVKKRGEGVAIYRSLPGEPPRKQTGRLRASVQVEVDEASLTARVGTNVEYGRHLELGTSKGLKPRPWLRRALAEAAARLSQILSGLGEP